MTATTEAAGPVAATRTAAQRRPVSPMRQALRLTRTEFTLMYRYRTALFFVLFPLVFVGLSMVARGDSPIPGVDAAALNAAGTPAIIAMMIGIMHVSNIYSARREQLILKRFRASGVPPTALFGATTLSVLAVVVLLSAVVVAGLGIGFGVVPADPVLVVLSVLVTTVTMALLGAALTRFARNAESAQMISMVPFLLLYASSGLMIPLEIFPDQVATAAQLLPTAPAVDLIRSGYLGYDLFGGVAQAQSATGAELWIAALPSLAVLLAWLAIAVLAVRFFRWDPRQPK
ncbi:ABC transporter permease [Streptomonospora litoralis]|uniref:ABC-2 family transporter protein n=1 Tax=Streptomonospora litoralis TaxID=2498135 RepID=A0A4P6PVQ7_9ACTN|nr:ABC transporter permease [Streptomonospora litoralis]QBI52316.1 ABC-2 family transporter protein [Streptomonospora litoralis]